MNFTELLIKQYAKKIYAFAYAKTKDYYNAQDLSQNIIMALCDLELQSKNIENMNAYINKVCLYSWSKYLRKNKKNWQQLNDYNFDYLVCDSYVEQRIINKELYSKLQQEIMFLSNTKRQVTIMYYYDNKSGKEIAEILNIPASTIRWHLSQAKKSLKERLTMTNNNTIYKPVKLKNSRNGWQQTYDPCNLGTDILMQNICWLCQGKALSVEEIAQTLSVAAVYLEDKIEKLVEMDYLTEIKNKYQANFFIADVDYQLKSKEFHLKHTMPIAKQLYEVVCKALPEIKQLNFNCNNTNDNYLKWQLIILLIFKVLNDTNRLVIENNSLQHCAPKRRDGSKHWAVASVPLDDSLTDQNVSKDLREFCLSERVNSIRHFNTTHTQALLFKLGFMQNQSELGVNELRQLKRVSEIINNNEKPNSYDKEAIVNLIQLGYVAKENEILKILVPYFTKQQMHKVNSILAKYTTAIINKKAIEQVFINYIKTMKSEIPSYVNKNERNHLLTGYSPYITILWLLHKNQYLLKPNVTEQKCLCTVVWEK